MTQTKDGPGSVGSAQPGPTTAPIGDTMGTQDHKHPPRRGTNRHPAMGALLEQVPNALRTRREIRGLSLRSAAAEIGINYNTMRRIESGHDYNVSNLRAVVSWLGGDA